MNKNIELHLLVFINFKNLLNARNMQHFKAINAQQANPHTPTRIQKKKHYE